MSCSMNFSFLLLIVAGSLFLTVTSNIASPPAQKNVLESALISMQKLTEPTKNQTPCTCGVFLNGQFTRGSPDPPKGNPALMYEQNSLFTCNIPGNKQCTNRCLESVSNQSKKM